VSIQIVKRIEIARKKRMIAEGTWYEDDEFDEGWDDDDDDQSGDGTKA
jgi:hypothetical protein